MLTAYRNPDAVARFQKLLDDLGEDTHLTLAHQPVAAPPHQYWLVAGREYGERRMYAIRTVAQPASEDGPHGPPTVDLVVRLHQLHPNPNKPLPYSNTVVLQTSCNDGWSSTEVVSGSTFAAAMAKARLLMIGATANIHILALSEYAPADALIDSPIYSSPHGLSWNRVAGWSVRVIIPQQFHSV